MQRRGAELEGEFQIGGKKSIVAEKKKEGYSVGNWDINTMEEAETVFQIWKGEEEFKEYDT